MHVSETFGKSEIQSVRLHPPLQGGRPLSEQHCHLRRCLPGHAFVSIHIVPRALLLRKGTNTPWRHLQCGDVYLRTTATRTTACPVGAVMGSTGGDTNMGPEHLFAYGKSCRTVVCPFLFWEIYLINVKAAHCCSLEKERLTGLF